MSEDYISVSNVSVEFKVGGGVFRSAKATVRAVQDVSFELAKGKTYAIVGESGSGKTTLARALVGLVKPVKWRVRIGGQDITGMQPEELRRFRRKVQLVLQDPNASIDPRMRVYDVLREALVVHGLHPDRDAQRRRIHEVIRKVGLDTAHLARFASELSGGQRQRVAIARGLMVEPEVLILDEPVSALDVSVQAQIVNLLKDLQAELGLTYVIITHDLALVGYIADVTGVMYLGRLVEQGDVEYICVTPSHPYTSSLLSVVAGEDPSVEKARKVEVLQGTIPSPLAIPSGCPFHSRCPHARKMAEFLPREELVDCHGEAIPRLCAEVAPRDKGTQGLCVCHFPLELEIVS